MCARAHLALCNVSLSNHRPHQDFWTSRFPRVCGRPYLCWRVLWAVYHTLWLVAGPVLAARDALYTPHTAAAAANDAANGTGFGGATAAAAAGGLDDTDDPALAAGKWFIYLSHWVYLILTMGCVTEAAIVTMATRKHIIQKDVSLESKTPCVLRAVWLMSTVSLTGSVMIALWYWTVLHKGKPLNGPRINTHGVAALYCVLDLFICRKPFRLLHAIYPVTFGVIYTAFSALYHLAGGTGRDGSPVIYPVLDWSSPLKTMVISSISNFLVIPVVHAMLWGLSLVFSALGDRCGGERGLSLSASEGRRVGGQGKGGRGGGGGGEYDLHVDTETSSSVGTRSSIGRCSTIEVYEGTLGEDETGDQDDLPRLIAPA